MDRTLIDRYEAQAPEPAAWASGLSTAQLDAHPVAGKWSVRELVCHVLESDLIASHRMKRIAAEELPLLIGYDETRFAHTLDYHGVDLSVVTDLFRLNRKLTAAILRKLPDEAFQRAGIHNQYGKLTLAYLVGTYVNHLEHHRPFLVAKRTALGAPMKM